MLNAERKLSEQDETDVGPEARRISVAAGLNRVA